MAPRFLTNPAPKTESAREARKSFFCELCQKGYARMNEFEAHESSYDHSHKKRLKEMKQMTRDPLATDKARRAERRADEKSGLIAIKPISLSANATSTSAGKGFKRGGFKSAFGAPADTAVEGSDNKPFAKQEGRVVETGGSVVKTVVGVGAEEEEEEDERDLGYEYYNPLLPTGCGSDCPCQKD
ncbi:hypothetical protein BJ546DRAFT_119164 [Cryomyces antarcticus]|nr:hypothetical protein LTR39_000573 [Cryomyces antarcticus]